jgi:ABC-type sugar transport system, permease component
MAKIQLPVGSNSTKSRIGRAIIWLVLLFGCVVFLIPFFWMISTSLKTLEEYYEPGINLLVKNPQPQNYVKALTTFPFDLYLFNTLLTTLIPVVFMCLSSAMVGYGFARCRAPGANFWFMIMLATMMVPGHVTMVPNFILFRTLGWINTLYPLIVPSMFGGAFNIFLMRQFYMRMPKNLEEAAKIDGCGAFKTWIRIFLPLSKPVITTVAIFTFIGGWNDFMGPLIYINSDKYKTLSLGLRSFISQYTTQTNLLMAASIVVILPCILLFFFMQRYFIQGITFTGEK